MTINVNWYIKDKRIVLPYFVGKITGITSISGTKTNYLLSPFTSRDNLDIQKYHRYYSIA